MPVLREPIPHVYVSLQELAALKHAGKSFTFLPRQPVTSLLSGRRASRLRGRGLTFEEMRLYHQGDDPRTIDWKATARTGETHVRVYTEERERPSLLVVDQRLSMFFGSRRDMKSVTAARAAALAAWRIVSVGDRVGAVVFNDRDAVEIKPQRSDRHVMRLISAIASFNHLLDVDAQSPGDPDALNRALQIARRLVTHDCLVTIISDFQGADATTRKWVTELRRHNDVLAIRVVDPLEVRLPDIGPLVVSDGTLQIDVDTANESLQSRFASEHEEVTDRMAGLSARYDVPTMELSTERDVPEQVREILGRLPKARRG